MPMQGTFDASQFAPKQMGESHPIGKFPFVITNTSINPTKEGNGGMFVVEFTSPNGTAIMRYNLWNPSEKAVEIAHGQLSALCHATGVFKLDWSNDGAALRGAKGMMDIGYQKGQEPTSENPNGGYTEIKRIYDINGNEPGKAAAAPAAPNANWQPPQQQQQPQQQPSAPPQQGGWSQPQGNGNAASGWGGSHPANTATGNTPAAPTAPPQQGITNPPWVR